MLFIGAKHIENKENERQTNEQVEKKTSMQIRKKQTLYKDVFLSFRPK